MIKMKKQEIGVYIERGMKISITKSWLSACINNIVEALGIKEPVEISLVVTNDESIKKLNAEYRGIDEPTDVLSFSMNTMENIKEPQFLTPPDKIRHLGEIVISYEKARVQARDYKHTIRKELFNLILHGVLHLLGYDHEESNDEKKMGKEAAKVTENIKQF